MEHGQLTGPNGMRNICGEYHDFAAVGIPQQGADLFGKVGTAVSTMVSRIPSICSLGLIGMDGNQYPVSIDLQHI